MSTYEVRIWAIREFRGRAVTGGRPRSTYRVRWVVAGEEFGQSFQTRAMAESFRSKLVVAQREGVAFDELTGLPEPMAREAKSVTWYQHALAYVDLKWPRSSAGHRRGIAEALATVTPALLATERGAPTAEHMQEALYGWAFNKERRDAGEPPAEVAAAIRWMEANTVNLTALVDAAVVRKALDALSLRQDGTPAAPSTVLRKRAIFSGALTYAVELRRLTTHPFSLVNWTPPAAVEEVDRRIVVNPRQARALLAAVRELAPELEAFFGCIYYAALRPEEVLNLNEIEYERPARPGGWGWLHLTGATVRVAGGWVGGNVTIERRGLKHRPAKATRDVPVAPPLVELLDRHLELFPPVSGWLFVTRRGPGGRYVPSAGQPVRANAYGKVWRLAREKALTPAQVRSLLAHVPYALRHAAVSLWLNAGVPATQVAEWAGHSVQVLLRIYAKCIDGQGEAARRRIEDALGLVSTDDASAPAVDHEGDQGGDDPNDPARHPRSR